MNEFYVYAYLRSKTSVSGVAGSPYYIGKGKQGRAFDRSRKSHSVNLPTDPSNIRILAADLSETDAFQAEMLLIHQYGRIDQATGCLRNRTDGGQGTSGAIWTEAKRDKQRMSQMTDAPGHSAIKRRVWSLRKRLGLPPLPTGGRKPRLENPSPRTLYMRQYRAKQLASLVNL